MLKTTYKPASSPIIDPFLPPGWTEHKAPSGHVYYYNAENGQSTYTKPARSTLAPAQTGQSAIVAFSPSLPSPLSVGRHDENTYGTSNERGGRGSFRGGRSYQERSRRDNSSDRPRSKVAIPDCEPWILVKTRLGRRFVYNPEKDESFWKFPHAVLLAVVEMDHRERELQGDDQREQHHRSREPVPAGSAAEDENIATPSGLISAEGDSDSYEEVEVTDNEAAAEEEDDDEEPRLLSKRQRIDEQELQGPVEYNEDDIAYQLAQMGQEYGLDPGEFGNAEEGYGNDYEEGAEGLALTEEDTLALFRDLLDDFRINPYNTWEKIVEDGKIIADDRYTVLSNMAARRQAFSDWSRDRIQELQERRKREEKKDPRIAYLRFLHEHATPKLYWPEFKRKFKKEPELKDPVLADKDREKLYRDHISRLKLPESSRKEDLSALLKEMTLRTLNRDSTLSTLPPALLTDLKFISLPSTTRDRLLERHILTLPPAPVETSDRLYSEQQTEANRISTDRLRREAALAGRERVVQEEKRKQRGALKHGRDMLRDEAAQLDQARRVGKQGLRSHMRSEGEDQAG